MSISDIIAVGDTKLPALDAYWYLFQRHPVVASCVNLIANTVAADGYSVQASGNADASDLTDDPRVKQIDEFWDAAFVNKDTFRRARFALTTDMLVFGRAFWRKKRAGSLMVGLERIDPRLVLPKPSPDRSQIDSFVIRKQRMLDGSLTQAVSTPWTDAEIVDPADIVFFTLGGGDQLLGAPAPLEHLDMTIGLDLAIRRYRQSFFGNGATPGKIITVKSGNRDQIRAIEEKVRTSKKGPERAFTTWVLGGDIAVEDRASDNAGQKDFDFVRGSGINREEICGVFHVPVGKITFSANALGSAGKAEDDATFQEQCVLPLEETLYEIITRDILCAEFEIDDLEMAPKRRHSLRLDMFSAAVQGRQIGMTGNELREMVNLGRVNDAQFEMDAPLFVGAIGGVASVEAPSAQGASEPNIDASTDAANKTADEVAQKGNARFRGWY